MTEPPDIVRRLISGINYLCLEAQSHEQHQAARLLRQCLYDLCRAYENTPPTPEHPGLPDLPQDSQLFALIDFLTQFAALKDDALKQRILHAIEHGPNPATRRCH